VTAENDMEQDVHYSAEGSDKTLCGLKSAATSSRELTCYRCHQFAVGDV
jgi:hypothetical protein